MIDYVDVDGFGRNFIARRLLDATSMKEALQVIIRPDAFVGHNYQIMSLDKREAYDIEVAPFGVVIIHILIFYYLVWYLYSYERSFSFPCKYV